MGTFPPHTQPDVVHESEPTSEMYEYNAKQARKIAQSLPIPAWSR